MNHVVVREMASSESRSTFCSTESPIKMTCETDDTETCTKALRLVSGSDSAIHPRDWHRRPSLKAVFTDILYWELNEADMPFIND